MKHLKQKTAEQLLKMTDSEIDYSDIPELDETFFKRAKKGAPSPSG